MHKTPPNLEALERFWRRSPFHDRVIEEVKALNRRVMICLADLTLVVTGVGTLERCETPAAWMSESLTPTGPGFVLDIETDSGRLRVTGADVRLIRNADLAMLIPPIDA